MNPTSDPFWTNIPNDVYEAARKVEDYFTEHTDGDWEFMGLQKRGLKPGPQNHAAICFLLDRLGGSIEVSALDRMKMMDYEKCTILTTNHHDGSCEIKLRKP